MSFSLDALRHLRSALGNDATFRDGQLDAILGLADQRARVLVVQRTGWGKSVVYFIATRLRRDEGYGPTILISPLLSLMRDQVRMATTLGLCAVTMDSTNPSSWDDIDAALAADEIDLLLVSPERLANERFRTRTLSSIPRGIGLFVVDEAHCISDWGHDFRPDYRRIRRITKGLPPGVPLLATTATANDRVIHDIEDQLGPDLVVIRGALGRSSLHLQVIQLEDQAERLAWLAEYLMDTDGSGIVYVLTVADARRVSDWLAERGFDAPAYYGGLNSGDRIALEEALRRNGVKALVATVALGMGFDKPDLSSSSTFSGRRRHSPTTSRSGVQVVRSSVRRSCCCPAAKTTRSPSTSSMARFRPKTFCGMSSRSWMSSATRSCETLRAASTQRDVIERALKILEVDAAIIHEGSAWARTVNAWSSATTTASRE